MMIAGCKGSATAPTTNGSIMGQTILVDRSCIGLPSGGITVELVGAGIMTTTDSNGLWALTNVPAGYYDIRCSKIGFSTYEWTDVEFVGAGVLNMLGMGGNNQPEILTSPTQTLLKADSTTVTVIAEFPHPPFANDSGIHIVVNFSLLDSTIHLTTLDGIIVYGSKTPTIDPRNPNTYFVVKDNEGSNTGQGAYLDLTEKINGVSAGDTLYVAAAYAPRCRTDPFSIHSGVVMKTVYPSVGPISNTIRVIVP